MFDIPFIVNTIFVAAVGSFFGSIVGAWVTHYYQKKRDDLAWGREIEKLTKEFNHDIEMANLNNQNELKKLEQQFIQQQHSQIRSEIMKDVHNPEAILQAIAGLQHLADEAQGRAPSTIRVIKTKG